MARPNDTRITPFLEAGPLRIYMRRGTGPYLLVVFSGVGQAHTGWQPIEFVRFARETPQHHVLFVVDGARSWLNAPAMIERIETAVATYRAATGVRRVVTMGNSMGGFMALALARRLSAYSSVAFSAQYSVHPEVVPMERRWQALRAQIADWRLRELGPLMDNRTRHFIVHGATGPEMEHWTRMPVGPEINHYLFPGQAHFVVRHLRDRDALHPFIEQALAGRARRAREVIEGAGGLKRRHYADAVSRLPAAAGL